MNTWPFKVAQRVKVAMLMLARRAGDEIRRTREIAARRGRQPPRESISDLKSSDLKGTEENSLRIPHFVESPSAIRSHDGDRR